MINMNKISIDIVLGILAFILITIQSCNIKPTNARYTPYNLANNQLQGHPKSIEEL